MKKLLAFAFVVAFAVCAHADGIINGGAGTPNATNSIPSNVSLNVSANYFDGPSVAQGSVGTWFASGTVTLNDATVPAQFVCKLWDGTTVIASTQQLQQSTTSGVSISLSGALASPAGNLRISCRDTTGTTGAMLSSQQSTGNASTITAIRLQ